MAKLDASSQTTAAIPSEIIQRHHGKPHTFSSQRSCLDMKFS
ncbi:putative B-block-binding subunit of tfiiic protein, partial [Trifolium medium]|nr:putative B-block-binding subunit of tfiiic protein [Trifolium medium]